MRRATVASAWLVCAIWLAACAMVAPLPPTDHGLRTHAVRVVSNGWHTAIVIGRAELVATGLLPEADDFPDAVFLEFGWGDRVYYPAREKTLGMALDAALTETPAVMHLASAPSSRSSGSTPPPRASCARETRSGSPTTPDIFYLTSS